MLRISQSEPGHPTVIVRLEGSLSGPWVATARESCQRLMACGHVLQLDLGDVDFVDGEGVQLLAELDGQAVAMLKCPRFVEERLKVSGSWRGRPTE